MERVTPKKQRGRRVGGRIDTVVPTFAENDVASKAPPAPGSSCRIGPELRRNSADFRWVVTHTVVFVVFAPAPYKQHGLYGKAHSSIVRSDWSHNPAKYDSLS